MRSTAKATGNGRPLLARVILPFEIGCVSIHDDLFHQTLQKRIRVIHVVA
jgi:hypothetical protein